MVKACKVFTYTRANCEVQPRSVFNTAEQVACRQTLNTARLALHKYQFYTLFLFLNWSRGGGRRVGGRGLVYLLYHLGARGVGDTGGVTR